MRAFEEVYQEWQSIPYEEDNGKARSELEHEARQLLDQGTEQILT